MNDNAKRQWVLTVALFFNSLHGHPLVHQEPNYLLIKHVWDIMGKKIQKLDPAFANLQELVHHVCTDDDKIYSTSYCGNIV